METNSKNINWIAIIQLNVFVIAALMIIIFTRLIRPLIINSGSIWQIRSNFNSSFANTHWPHLNLWLLHFTSLHKISSHFLQSSNRFSQKLFVLLRFFIWLFQLKIVRHSRWIDRWRWLHSQMVRMVSAKTWLASRTSNWRKCSNLILILFI